jgi:hypothetical protein
LIAILSSLFFVTGGSGVLAVLLIAFLAIRSSDNPNMILGNNAGGLGDTGAMGFEKDGDVALQAQKKKWAGGGAVVAADAAPEIDTGPAPIRVLIKGDHTVPYIKMSCNDGTVERQKVRNNRVMFNDVPRTTKCKLSVDGGVVANFTWAYAAKNYTCDIRPPQLVCRG